MRRSGVRSPSAPPAFAAAPLRLASHPTSYCFFERFERTRDHPDFHNQECRMQNAMKSKIQRGEVALGVSLMFPSPQLVEMMAYVGFDWVLIDCEHGSIGPADIELMAMAADASGITPIARPCSNSAADIQFALD